MTLRRSPQASERVTSDPTSHTMIQPRPHEQPTPSPYAATPYPYPYNPGSHQQPPPQQQAYAVNPGYSPYAAPQRHSPYAQPTYARGYPQGGSPSGAISTGLPASPYAARGITHGPPQYNPYPTQQPGHYQPTIQTGPYPSQYPVPAGSYGSTSPQSSNATAPDGGSPTTNPAGGPVRRGNKTHVPSACINCKKAHLACDMSRPCRRCVSLNKHDTCIDIKHKKRGRPKIVKDVKKQDSSPVSPQSVQSQDTKSSWSQSQMAPVPTYALSSSSVSVSSGYTIPAQPPIDDGPLITIYASFDNIACGRVSDECLQLLGFYPQELAHQPLFNFVHHLDRGKLVRLVENLINTCNSRHPTLVFTPTECIPSNFPALFEMRPQDLLAIAPGSPIVTDTMRMRQRNESFDLMTLRMYIGGALGADVDRRETLSRSYLVISLAKAKADVSPRSSIVTEYAANVSGYPGAYPQQYGQYAPSAPPPNPPNTPLYATGFGAKGPAGPAQPPTSIAPYGPGSGSGQGQGPLPPLLPRPQSAPGSAVTPPNQHTAIPSAPYRYNPASAPAPQQPSYAVPVQYPYPYPGPPPVGSNYYEPRPQAPLYAHPNDAGYYHTKQAGVGVSSMAPPPSNTPRGNNGQGSTQSVGSGESDEPKRHPVHS